MLMPQPQRGFTLIELMISITLIALLLALGLPSFTQWLQNAQIRTAADSTLAGLQLARAEAVRRNVLVEFIFTSTSPVAGNTGAAVASTTGPNWMVRLFQAGGGNTSADFVRGRANTEGTPNATFTASQASIVFNSLGRVTPTPAASITVNVTNSVGGANRPLRIVITPAGQVRMCDPNLPSGNVQAC